MKLNKWLYGAAALAMLAACSDKDVAPGGGSNGENGSAPSETVNGYIAVEIKLPQDAGSTRGETNEENDYFKDGTANEYLVKNALIAIFKGPDEKNAEFVRAQVLQKPFFTSTPTDDNITSSYLAAIEVQTEVDDDDVFWAWVMLNTDFVPDRGSEPENFSTNIDNFEIGGVKVIPPTNTTKGTTFGEILSAKITDSPTKDSFVTGTGKDASKFFMTNAPLSTVGSASVTSANISYLTNIGTQLYDTIEEAKAADDRACVYVERAVAKLTCTELTDDKLQLEFYDENGEKINTDNWKISVNSFRYGLTNTPYDSFIIRNVEFEEDDHFKWKYASQNGVRFVGTTPMPGLNNPFHAEDESYYRTYWCIDPYYSSDMPAASKKKITAATDLVNWDNPLYCKENTFNVECQNYKNTNIAIFELDLSIEGPEDENRKRTTYGNLYVKDGNNSKIYVSRKAVYADGISRIINNTTIQNDLKEAAKAAGKTLPTDENGTITLANIGNYLKYSWNETGDNLEISKIELDPNAAGFSTYFDTNSINKFNELLGSKDNEESDHSKILQDVNGLSDVTIYAGGKSYYYIPVKHFGNYYTPWGKDDEGNDITGTTTKEVYNPAGKDKPWDSDHARLYLGRYGMVRNNWYELNVSKISALGDQHIPNVDIEMSDDNNQKKQFFAVEIHILSWAKRTQSVSF